MKVGVSAAFSRTFTEEDVKAYQALCGPLDSTQVPEPLVGALWSCLLGVHLPGIGTMYLKQETEFSGSVRVGEPLTAEVEITRIRPEKHLADLKTTCRNSDGELIAEGRALVYTGFVEGWQS